MNLIFRIYAKIVIFGQKLVDQLIFNVFFKLERYNKSSVLRIMFLKLLKVLMWKGKLIINTLRSNMSIAIKMNKFAS